MTQYLRCEQCNRYLVMVDDGAFVCLAGHGGFRPDTLDEPEPVLPSLFITGEEADA